MSRQLISSGSEFESKIGYSRAVVDDNFVFVSGTTGYDYTTMTMTISESVIEQADQCLKNIEQVPKSAGSDLSGIVRIRYILPNRADFEPCWPVFQKYLGTVLPAATVFEAGLLDEKMKIEIEVTAKLSTGE